MYTMLEEHGRRNVIRTLREGVTPEPGETNYS